MKTRLLIVFTILTLPLLAQSVHSLELDTSSYSLKQQIKEGWDIESLFCHNDQVLILKITDESPACVNPETKEKLLERGWAILTPKERLYDIEKTLSDKDCVEFGRWLDEFVDGNFNENNLIFDLPVSDELSQRIYDSIPDCVYNDSGGFFKLNTKHFIDFEKLEKPSDKYYIEPERKAQLEAVELDLRNKITQLHQKNSLVSFAVNLDHQTHEIIVIVEKTHFNNEIEKVISQYPDDISIIFTNEAIRLLEFPEKLDTSGTFPPELERSPPPLNKMTLFEDPFFTDPDKFVEISEKKDSKCFTTPSMNYFCYAKPRMYESGIGVSWLISNTTKISGELHFDNVNVGPSYFTMKNMTQIKGDTAKITFADKDYRVGNATYTRYEITDDFEFTTIIEKFDTFVAKCDNYDGTSVTVVQYLGITTIDGVDYFMTWHLNAHSEEGITCDYPQIIQNSFDNDFGNIGHDWGEIENEN